MPENVIFGTGNPYIIPISPSDITIIEGQPLTIRFRVAVNSDGNFWDTSRTSFYFAPTLSLLGEADTMGEIGEVETLIPFQIPEPDYPQDYVYSVDRVMRRHGGVYSARVHPGMCA